MLLGSAYGKVELDSSGVTKGVKSAVTDLEKMAIIGEKVGAAMTSLGNKMTIGLTLPIAALGGAAIKAASDFEETKNKTQVIFGDMAKDILEWSENSAQAFGQSQTQALDAASNFAIFGKAANLAGDDLAEFAKSNTELASDLASFFNTSPEQAITAIGAAYRGESEPIRNYGVLINEAALQQKALELGIISSLGPITQQQRIIAANALILEQTSDAQGDFARTSDGLANSTKTLNAEFQKTLVKLGDNLLPITLEVVKALNKLLEAFNKMSPEQQKMVVDFLAFLAVLGPILSVVGKIITIFTTLSSLFGSGGALAGLGTVFSGLGTVLTTTIIPAAVALGTALIPILAVLAAIILTVGLVAIAWKTNFLGIRDTYTAAFKIMKAVWEAFTAFLRGDTDEALEHLREAFDIFGERVNQIFEKIFNIRNAWQRFLTFMQTALSRTLNYIRDAFARVDWSLVGKYILQGIANGMLGGLPALISAAGKVVQSLLNTFDNRLQIRSPSKVFEKRGMLSALGYMQGMQNTMNADQISRALVRPVTNNSSTQQTIIQNFASGLTVRQVQNMIDERIDSLAGAVMRTVPGG